MKPGLLRSLSFSAILLAQLIPCPAEAQGTLKFQDSLGTLSGTYLVDSEVALTRTVTVAHRGSAAKFFITFSAGQSGSFGARALLSGADSMGYQIFDNLSRKDILKDLSASPSAVEVLTGSFGCSQSWQQQSLSFSVYLFPGQFPPAGQYLDTVIVQLYEGTPSCRARRIACMSFKISMTMNTALDVSLVQPGAPFDQKSTSLTLDAGVLSSGIVKAADLIVRSNTRYTISVASQNGGVLKNGDPADASNIPYQFSADGRSLTLPRAGSQPIASGTAPTGLAGKRFGLSVTIGTVGWATEGAYSDILTFQAMAN
jgi:spore coat protein U-like protein